VCPKGDSEGRGAGKSPADGDDAFCFPAKEALVYKVTGCTLTNDPGFDGASYQKLWPDGSKSHPTGFRFASPTTGKNYTTPYSTAGFEVDLPALEAGCNTSTGAGCKHIPTTDMGKPAAFYPFYVTTKLGSTCYWQIGNDVPGMISDFGKNAQYGKLLGQNYTSVGGGSNKQFNDFEHLVSNPCK